MIKRVLTAICLLAIVIPCILFSRLLTAILYCIMVCIANHEILKLVGSKYSLIEKLLSYLLCIYPFCSYFQRISLYVLLFTILVTLVIYSSFVIFNKEVTIKDIAIHFVITCLMTSSLYLFTVNEGLISLYIIATVILTDSFALFGGKLIGKHKLIERISPNKTVEGAICGTLFSTIIVFVVFKLILKLDINIFITILLSIFSQIGDLFFSAVKRHYQIKDFGNLLPGHGGVLDRLDSISFACVIYNCLLILKVLFI